MLPIILGDFFLLPTNKNIALYEGDDAIITLPLTQELTGATAELHARKTKESRYAEIISIGVLGVSDAAFPFKSNDTIGLASDGPLFYDVRVISKAGAIQTLYTGMLTIDPRTSSLDQTKVIIEKGVKVSSEIGRAVDVEVINFNEAFVVSFDAENIASIAAKGIGGGLLIPKSADIPFADIDARNLWAINNLQDLIEGTTAINVTTESWFIWRGESNPESYNQDLWVNGDELVKGQKGEKGETVKISAISNDVIGRALSTTVSLDDGTSATSDPTDLPESGVIFDGVLTPEIEVTNGIKGEVKDGKLLLAQTMARTAWYFVDVPVSSVPYEIKTGEQMGIDYELVGSPEPQSVQLFQEGLADGSQIKVSVNGYKSTDKPVNVFQETPTGTYNWHITTPTVFMLHNSYWRVEESSQLIHIDGATVYGTNAAKSPVHAITTDPASALTAIVNNEGVMILGADSHILDQYQRKDAEEIDYPVIKQSGNKIPSEGDIYSIVDSQIDRIFDPIDPEISTNCRLPKFSDTGYISTYAGITYTDGAIQKTVFSGTVFESIGTASLRQAYIIISVENIELIYGREMTINDTNLGIQLVDIVASMGKFGDQLPVNSQLGSKWDYKYHAIPNLDPSNPSITLNANTENNTYLNSDGSVVARPSDAKVAGYTPRNWAMINEYKGDKWGSSLRRGKVNQDGSFSDNPSSSYYVFAADVGFSVAYEKQFSVAIKSGTIKFFDSSTGLEVDDLQHKSVAEIDYPLIKQAGDDIATAKELQSEVEKLLPLSGGTITGNLKIVDDSDESIFETNKETKSISYKGRQTDDNDVITVAAVKSLIDNEGSDFDPKKWFGSHHYEEVSSSVSLNVEVAHIALTTDGGWTTSVVFSPDLDYGEVYIIANRGTGPYKIANITAPNLKTMQVKVFKDLTYHVKVSATEGVSVEAIKSSNEVSTSDFDVIDTSSFDDDVKIKLLKKSFENKDLISIPVEIPDGFEIIVSSVLCKSDGKVKRELFEYVYENGILRVHLQSTCSGLIIAELIK